MPPERPWKDEYTLLCERCGYVIEGLDRAVACPECGKPIEESLPERRTGTPWRCRPSARALAATWWATLRHPMKSLDLVRPSRRHDRSLARWSILTGALLMSVGWWHPSLLPVLTERVGALPFWIVFVAATTIVAALFLGMLTAVETGGLGIIARSRSFRVSKDYRRAITAHGSVGWVIAGILFWALNFLAGVMIDISRPPPASFESAQLQEIYGGLRGPAPRSVYWIAWSMRGFGLLSGFFFFETFAYLGLRRLKYANRARPIALQRGPPSAAPEDQHP